ncbi:MAG: hypothetical protein M3388_04265 [Acidobacteriota bacterium]|nr:hypothetical protein [Acidobacteriota bacterium]
MAIYDDKWFEIWYADGIEYIPSHLLIITPKPENRSSIIVIDPYLSNKIIYEGKDYEDVSDWLVEDEYSLVSGRIFPDDGWG